MEKIYGSEASITTHLSLPNDTDSSIRNDIEHAIDYSATKLPNSLGFILWDNTLADINQLLKEWRSSQECFILPKIIINQCPYVIHDYKLATRNSPETAGTVLEVDHKKIMVKLREHGVMTVFSLLRLDGRPILLTELIMRHQLTANSWLAPPKQLSDFADIHQIRPYEAWVKRNLQHYQAYPFSIGEHTIVHRETLELDHALLKTLGQKHNLSDFVMITGIIISIFTRFNQETESSFDILLSHNHSWLKQQYFSEFIPINVSQSDCIEDIFATVFKATALTNGFFKEMYAQIPQRNSYNHFSKIGFLCGDSGVAINLYNLRDYRVLFVIKNATVAVHYLPDRDDIVSYYMAVFQTHYALIVSSLLNSSESSMYCWSTRPKQNHIRTFKQALENVTQTIHQCIESQADTHPDNIAVVFEDDMLTYQQLNEKANQLANLLITEHQDAYDGDPGVGTVVAICLDKGLDMLVAILAVLKTGSAYLPLDTGAPLDRNHYIIDNSEPAFVISTAQYIQQYALQKKCASILLDDDLTQTALHGQSPYNLNVSVSPNSLAYVIYTSGSTGHPKGVLIPHSNVMHLFASIQQKGHVFSSDNIWSFYHSYAFDFSIWEMFGALFYGAKLIMMPPKTVQNLEVFFDILHQRKITDLSITPSAFKQFINVNKERLPLLSHLKYVTFGGEKLDMVLLKDCITVLKNTSFINMYGITEITVHGTYKKIEPYDIQQNISNMGQPLSHLHFQVLDKSLDEVPTGIWGELYISGLSLADGYLGNKELTHKKFIVHPASASIPATVWYKTGDIVRTHPNGDYEFYGRMDSQVKINGYRIELEEIESVLNRHPDIKQSVVFIHGNDIHQTLVAFIVTHHLGLSETVKQWACKHLPPYMVPQSFFPIETIPLTLNNKVDTQALHAHMAYRKEHRPIQPVGYNTWDRVERQLSIILSQLFPYHEFGLTTHFQSMGLSSLQIAHFCMVLKKELQTHVSPAIIFQHPSVAELAFYIKKHQLKLDELQIIPLKKHDEKACYPLSFEQRRFWFLNTDNILASKAYTLTKIYKISGVFHLALFEQAFNLFLKQQPCLRTVIKTVNFEPVQAFKPYSTYQVKHSTTFDETRHIEALVTAQIDACTLKENHLLFMLETLSNVENNTFIVFSAHHIISDGFSIDLLFNRLFEMYHALDAGLPKRTEALSLELTMTYADYVLSQHQAITGDAFKQGVQFWKTRLLNAEQAINLPYDYPRAERQTYEGDRISLDYDHRQLLSFSRTMGCTVYAVLFSAYALLLHKLSGQSDLTIGTVCQTRNHIELESVFGYFLNTIPVRTQINADESLALFIKKFSKNLIDCLAYAEVPFGQIVAETQSLSSMKFYPIFQLLFTYFEHPKATDIPGCTIDAVGVTPNTSRYDMSLDIEHNANGLVLHIEYDKHLFNKKTIYGFFTYYCNILDQMIADSEQLICHTDLLDDVSLHMMYHQLNDHTRDLTDTTLGHLFEQTVIYHPDTVAIVFEKETFSFAELDELSHHLAWQLQQNAIKKGDVVAVCLSPTPALPITILAVLKLGAIYLPLEPDFPRNRLNFMLDDSKASLCVVDDMTYDVSLNTSLFVYHPPKIQTNTTYPTFNYNGHDPVYLVYTSGSTGAPKGVLGSYQATLNRFTWMWDLLPFGNNELSAVRTSVAFVDSIWEILGPLLAGSPICILSTSQRKDLGEFTHALETYKITRLSTLPSLLREWVVYWKNNHFSARYLKHIITSGEALPVSIAKEFLHHFSFITLFNLYGSSEVAGDVSYHQVQKSDFEHRTIPIGVPIQNTQLYVCDKHGRILAPGEVGELVVSGQALSLGYLNNPALTDERFSNKTLWSNPTKVFYTKDTSRLLFNGQFEYLGRLDSVEKVRGVRVNLAEIDEVLALCKDIKTSVSLVIGDQNKRIKTLIVTHQKALTPALKDHLVGVVRETLRQELPAYLQPDLIAFIDELPLNNSGKIDKARLKTYQNVHFLQHDQPIMVQSDVADMLTSWVKELTKNDHINPISSLISQGFNSLDIIVLINKISHEFQQNISIKEFFSTPSIAALSQFIEQKKNLIDSAFLTESQYKIDHSLSFQQQQICFIQRSFACGAAFQLSGRLNVDGPLDIDMLTTFLDLLYKRHPILGARITHAHDHSFIDYGYSQLQLQVIRINENTDIDAYVQQYLNELIDMTHTLFRTTVIRISHNQHIVLFQAHHIIFDAWAFHIFIKELADLYQGRSEHSGRQNNLSYAHYVLKQKEYVQTSAFLRDCEFWLQELANAPQHNTWPEIYTRPSTYTFDGEVIRSSIHKDLYTKIQAFSADKDITVFTYFLSCYLVLLYHKTQRNDLMVGVPISNRIEGSFHNTIGLFSNTLPLRITIDDNMTVSQLFADVKHKMIALLSHQNMTLTQLLDLIKPKRLANKHPFFQTIFSYNDQHDSYPQLGPNMSGSFETCSAQAIEYDFSLFFFCSDQSIDILLKYNSNIYNKSYILEILNAFHTTSAQCFYHSNLPVGKLSTATKSAALDVINYGKGAIVDLETDSIMALITQSAGQHRHKIALTYKNRVVTYEKLLDLIHQLSFQLSQVCTPTDATIIGVVLKDPIDRLIAMLAIFHHQAIYLPLDPDDPIERLNIIAEDSCPAIVISSQSYKEKIASLSEIILIEDMYQAPNTSISYACKPDSPNRPIYMLYTSGSTGKPKGTLIGQHSVLNVLSYFSRQLQIDHEYEVISLSEYTFDISILEHLIPLMHAASLFFFDKHQKRELNSVADKINATPKPFIQLTPSYLSLLSTIPISPNRHMIVMIGGEPLSQSLADFLLNLTDQVWHVYGPTEACIWCTVKKMSKTDKDIYIGAPIDNVNVYVLDDNLEPLGIGMRGNLYLSGKCLAIGYHNNPKLTQDKFFIINNDYLNERVYDTGDLACWVEPGLLRYIGRKDRQIKFLGHRIELGEIETALNAHPSIKSSAIRVEGNPPSRLSAFYVTVENVVLTQHDILDFLSQQLPQGYVPHAYHQIPSLPLTRNGKIDYSQLSATSAIQKNFEKDTKSLDYEQTTTKVTALWRKLLSHADFDAHQNFFDIGGNSFLLMQMLFDLQNLFPIKLTITDLFSKSTVRDLSHHIYLLTHPLPVSDITSAPALRQEDKIAVIGMAIQAPGAPNLDAFWDNLCHGKETLTQFLHEFDASRTHKMRSFVPCCGVVAQIEYFDADFFEISHAHSTLMDPQQRLLLECSWSALENAAYVPENYDKRIGIVASTGTTNYFRHYVLPTLNEQPDDAVMNEFTAYLLNDKDFAATRIAYHLNLTGPAISIGTACSSSLVAIIEACRLLTTNAADMMLAGGASLLLPNQRGYWYQPDHILSQDGHCRAFSDDASGTVPSSGVGVVVLKRLSDALNDHDHIIAVIEGSAVNNDGKQKLGFTTPSYLQQKQCITSAISHADFADKPLAFIEAHGTGTKLGDAIEMKALAEAYQYSQTQSCAVGSVKSNLGHTDTASGVTSFIKAALSLYHKLIVPTLNFNSLNANIELESSPLYINTQLKKLDTHTPLYGAVNSLGLGGTNAHLILSNHKAEDAKPSVRPWHVIKISAPKKEICDQMAALLSQTLSQEQYGDLDVFKNVCFTLLIGRRDFNYRKVFICRDRSEALQMLHVHPVEYHESSVQHHYVFVIPDFDDTLQEYGQSLYQQEPGFQETVDALCSKVKALLHYDLHPWIHHQQVDLVRTTKNERFCYYLVIHFAMATYLMSLGIQPQRVVGLGFGQYVALLVSGELTLHTVLNSLFLKSVIEPQKPQHMIPTASGFDNQDIVLTELSSTYHFDQSNLAQKDPICFNIAVDERDVYVLLTSTGSIVGQHLKQSTAKVYEVMDNHHDADAFYKFVADCVSWGVPLNHEDYFYKQNCKRVILPNYPFQKKQFWMGAEDVKPLNHIYIRQLHEEHVSLNITPCDELLIVIFGQHDPDVVSALCEKAVRFKLIHDPKDQFDFKIAYSFQSILILYHIDEACTQQDELNNWMNLIQFVNAVAHKLVHPLRMTVVSCHLQTGQNYHTHNHWRSILPSTCLGLSQEHFLLFCGHIDISESMKNNEASTNTIQHILAIHGSNQQHHAFALNNNNPCFYRYEPLKQRPLDLPVWVPNGVYLIIGGLGKMGSTVMRHISQKCKATFIVTTRGRRSESAQNSIIEPIKQSGSRVFVHDVDVAEMHSVQQFMTSLHSTETRFDGIFYCAGLSGEPSLCAPTQITLTRIDDNFKAKAYGLCHFLSTLKDEQYAYAILMSSMSSELVGPGQILYAAANRYAESLVSHLPRWQIIQWDNWSLETTHKPGGYISASYALDALEQIIALNIPVSLVSQDNIDTRFQSWTHTSTFAATSKKTGGESIDFHDYFYKLLIEIFGKHDLNMDKNFLELGGDSLLAIDIRSKVFRDYGFNITLDEFIHAPSVKALSNQFLAQRPAKHSSSAQLISMKKGDPQTVVILIHPVTGSIYCYTPLVKHLDLNHTIVAIENYTFDSKMLHDGVTQTAEHYINLILSSIDFEQCILVGLSYGGTVALEMAKIMHAKGLKTRLIMIDSWAHFNDETWDQKSIYQNIVSRMDTLLEHKLLNSEEEKNGLIDVMYQRIKQLQAYQPSHIDFPLVLIKAKELLPEYQIINDPNNHWINFIDKKYLTVILANGHHDSVLLEEKTAAHIRQLIEHG